MAQRDAAATWVGFARWQPKGTRITLVFQGTPPSTLVRLAHDGCASKPRPGQPVIVFGRRGQLPLATPMIKAGLVELAHFMKAGRPGVAPATSAAIHYALQRALPRYLRGRSVSVRFAKLAGTRQRLSGVRLRFVATAARRGVTICTATSRGPLHYIAGFTPEGDARGRPLDRYQGFQVVFLSDKVAKPGATASSKLLAVIRPKSYLHGHCP